MAKAAKAKERQIDIQPIKMGRCRTYLLGTTPMIMHRFATKAWHELLLPSGRKNEAEKMESLKHDPLTEFRETCYRNRDASEPTALHYPCGAFSKAMAAAALDIPGASKAQMLRLVSITSVQVNVYGIPMLGMSMVRSSDIGRTPDVRTRAYLPEWCVAIDVEYVSSLISQTQIFNLIGAAGVIVGIGDYRPQKGGTFGKFMCVDPNDKNLLRIMKQQGRAAQEAALRSPSFFDEDSAELYGWFSEEIKRREKTPPSHFDVDGLPQLQPKTLAEAAGKEKKARKKRNGKSTPIGDEAVA